MELNDEAREVFQGIFDLGSKVPVKVLLECDSVGDWMAIVQSDPHTLISSQGKEFTGYSDNSPLEAVREALDLRSKETQDAKT